MREGREGREVSGGRMEVEEEGGRSGDMKV